MRSLLIYGIFTLIMHRQPHGMHAPLASVQTATLSLAPSHLPEYALRTVLRMMAAILASTLFTFIYATMAAKNKRAEMVLIPILDILQSVPVLGFLSFTVVFFLRDVPGQMKWAPNAPPSSPSSRRKPGT